MHAASKMQRLLGHVVVVSLCSEITRLCDSLCYRDIIPGNSTTTLHSPLGLHMTNQHENFSLQSSKSNPALCICCRAAGAFCVQLLGSCGFWPQVSMQPFHTCMGLQVSMAVIITSRCHKGTGFASDLVYSELRLVAFKCEWYSTPMALSM